LSGRGNFFAVDRRAWGAVCGLGSINAAVAFLVMARGTLADMKTTAWSTNAIEDRTSISRHLAKEAIERLVKSGLVERKRAGKRPLYVLATDAPRKAKPALTPEEQHVLDKVDAAGGPIWVPKVGRFDQGWNGGNPYALACQLVRKGYLRSEGDQRFGLEFEPSPSDAHEWVWLPSEIIDGAAGETPAVEILRQSQHLPALRLFVDLYHAQSLPRYGGISWRQIRKPYTKRRIGQRGAHIIWGFEPQSAQAWHHPDFVRPHIGEKDGKPSLDPFFHALGIITQAGLAGYVPHLIEADSDEAAILFPYALANLGQKEEQAIAWLAHEAGHAMLAEHQSDNADTEGLLLAPLLPHTGEAQMLGILRMRYQAGTAANVEWLQDNRPRWRETAECLAGLAGKPFPEQAFAISTRDQTEIKSGSTRDQIQG
jgi:hypothetical protein